jgi:hypothetical protein
MIRSWLNVFFAAAGCSWVPHWACHYYRLETGSSFVVGSWEFTRADSLIFAGLYTCLIALNLVAIRFTTVRFWAALLSGLCHLFIAGLHGVRLFDPFRFEVFGYQWSSHASIREVAIVLPFGILCLWVAWYVARQD